MQFILTLIYCYVYLILIGLFMLILRDDRKLIFEDLKKGFNQVWYILILHAFLISLIMPLTIPFSLGRILNKWL
jgi:hypothetical protein|tara:strand:+ start:7135 stop:7356 length:222 start_codon:yes stop_codon:yes gene_type:complete